MQFNDAQSNRDVEYLPQSADSLEAIHMETAAFGDELLTGMLVYHDGRGLSNAARVAVAKGAAGLNARPMKGQYGKARPIFFKDRDAAAIYFQMRVHGEKELVFAAADRLHAIGERAPAGVVTKLTGQAGFINDQVEIYDQIDSKLLIGTVILISLLLLLIYRSPFLWLLPLISVGFAEVASRGLATQLSHHGVTITSQSAALMTVLVFGVGTDYALLLIARYRDELRRTEDHHEAMADALARTGPTIFASAATVVLALMCMTVADVNATRSAGPIGAMGIAIAMLAMLTLLPTLLITTSRGVFWPSIPRLGDVSPEVASGFWSRLADRIAKRPVVITVLVFGLMAVMALGLTQRPGGLDLAGSFHKPVESVTGMKLLERALPPGATGPVTVMVGDSKQLPIALAQLKGSPDIASINGVQRIGGVTRIEASLKYSPYSDQAMAAIPRVRDQLGGAGLVSGATAIEVDSRHFAAQDNKLIMPLVLLVVLLVLLLLLRAVVAPLVLMVTVVCSFLAAMGASYWVFQNVFGFTGVDEFVPLFVFIFLVALGVDYNIFLMARVREEAMRFGARQGMKRGLIVTGGVITSAGIVLAGTFFVMAAMPITTLTEIGFAIAVGVIFDALIVRSALVPALGFLLGPKLWWPSRLAKIEATPPPMSSERSEEPAEVSSVTQLASESQAAPRLGATDEQAAPQARRESQPAARN